MPTTKSKAKLTDEEKRARKLEKERAEEAKRVQGVLDRSLEDLRRRHINQPIVHRQVGERVQHGQIKQSVIKDILDGGKIYLLDEICTEHNYGNPFEVKRDFYIAWNQVTNYRTPEEIERLEILSYRDEAKLYYSNTTFSSLAHKYYDGIDMNPEYQRGDVWNLNDKLTLLESMFNNVDIGKFTLIQLPYSPSGPHYEILDGKQRLTALIEFIEGRYPFKGKTFSDLHPRDQHHIMEYSVSFAMAENLTLKQKAEYFLKLNTAGKPQDPQHLEKVRKIAKS